MIRELLQKANFRWPDVSAFGSKGIVLSDQVVRSNFAVVLLTFALGEKYETLICNASTFSSP